MTRNGLITSNHSRRTFIQSCAATVCTFGGLGGGLGAGLGAGFQISGSNSTVGHLLREKNFPPPSRTIETGIAIVGGGISGLSAAWRLSKKGFHDFLLFELESEVGGNSKSDENSVSAFPWGAHYVPTPSPHSKLVFELFEELGVLKGYDPGGAPIYDEEYLCFDPQEKLFIYDRWQEGLVPQRGLSAKEQSHFQAFFQAMEDYKSARGTDGRPAFVIPLEWSSKDPRFLSLDQFSMAHYLKIKGWDSPHLKWYINYCCRDDYGSNMDQVSAWAGIHYFASRTGKTIPTQSQNVLTWPEGNGWIVKKLKSKIQAKIRSNHLVFSIEKPENQATMKRTQKAQWKILIYDVQNRSTVEVKSNSVIYCAPRFTAPKVIASLQTDSPPSYLKSFSYAPWLVANITVKTNPRFKGAPFEIGSLAWDNVPFQGRSLGFICATHQKISQYSPQATVFTYYLPLTDQDPTTARKWASQQTTSQWCKMVLEDLNQMFPANGGSTRAGPIDKWVTDLKIWIWGHGMIRPTPGFIWGSDRKESLKPILNPKGGTLYFAHSDMSGISIFEEAQFRGVEAAELALKDRNLLF